jgi:hypothetical protein
VTTDQDERARRRDERERHLIASLALIAPTPELLREVIALGSEPGADRPPRPAVIEVEAREPLPA